MLTLSEQFREAIPEPYFLLDGGRYQAQGTNTRTYNCSRRRLTDREMREKPTFRPSCGDAFELDGYARRAALVE